MSTTELYNAVPIIGQKYKRAAMVTIENTLNGIPRVTFHECDVVVAEDGSSVATLPNDSCTAFFDINNPAHLELYSKLNDLYITTREARDLANAPSPPVEP
jgi:hypothetical protein